MAVAEGGGGRGGDGAGRAVGPDRRPRGPEARLRRPLVEAAAGAPHQHGLPRPPRALPPLLPLQAGGFPLPIFLLFCSCSM